MTSRHARAVRGGPGLARLVDEAPHARHALAVAAVAAHRPALEIQPIAQRRRRRASVRRIAEQPVGALDGTGAASHHRRPARAADLEVTRRQRRQQLVEHRRDRVGSGARRVPELADRDQQPLARRGREPRRERALPRRGRAVAADLREPRRQACQRRARAPLERHRRRLEHDRRPSRYPPRAARSRPRRARATDRRPAPRARPRRASPTSPASTPPGALGSRRAHRRRLRRPGGRPSRARPPRRPGVPRGAGARATPAPSPAAA